MTRFIAEQLGASDLDGKSVCIIVPDATRTLPYAAALRAVHAALHGRVSRMTTLVALGTHQPMSETALARTSATRRARSRTTYPGMAVVNHEWWEP